MKDYWLAKLIASVGEINSRKRLQKSVYLLQRAGCPLQCDYILHYYGPYSFEVAGLIDQLDRAGIIEEKPAQLREGVIRYTSAITEKGREVLASFEASTKGDEVCKQIEPFVSRFGQLVGEDLWVLELAATVGYYYDGNWEQARMGAAAFKGIRNRNDDKVSQAADLAKKYVQGQ